jgi:hypothetical protein
LPSLPDNREKETKMKNIIERISEKMAELAIEEKIENLKNELTEAGYVWNDGGYFELPVYFNAHYNTLGVVIQIYISKTPFLRFDTKDRFGNWENEDDNEEEEFSIHDAKEEIEKKIDWIFNRIVI